MNLINAICCVLLARGSEFGQSYLVNNQGMLRRRVAATAADANRFIEGAIQELTLSGGEWCRCDTMVSPSPASPSPDNTGRRRSLLERIRRETY